MAIWKAKPISYCGIVKDPKNFWTRAGEMRCICSLSLFFVNKLISHLYWEVKVIFGTCTAGLRSDSDAIRYRGNVVSYVAVTDVKWNTDDKWLYCCINVSTISLLTASKSFPFNRYYLFTVDYLQHYRVLQPVISVPTAETQAQILP